MKECYNCGSPATGEFQIAIGAIPRPYCEECHINEGMFPDWKARISNDFVRFLKNPDSPITSVTFHSKGNGFVSLAETAGGEFLAFHNGYGGEYSRGVMELPPANIQRIIGMKVSEAAQMFPTTSHN